MITPKKEGLRLLANLALAGLAFLAVAAQAQSGPPVIRGLWVTPSKMNGETEISPLIANVQKQADSFREGYVACCPGEYHASITVLKGAQVTRENVLTKMQSILKQMPRGSIFVFYYGGHGVPSGKTVNYGTYLAMENCEIDPDKTPTYANMLLLSEIVALQAQYEKVYFTGFVDSCFAGDSSLNAEAFSSSALGPRAFLLCSSNSTRESFAAHFTKALATIYHDKPTLSQLTFPDKLREQIKTIGIAAGMPTQQQPRLLPNPCDLRMTLPMPGLCLVIVDLRSLIAPDIVNLKSSRPGNQPPMGDEINYHRRPVGCIAFSVPAVNGTNIEINFDNVSDQLSFSDLQLANKAVHVITARPPSGVSVLALDSSAESLELASADFRAAVQRAKAFGISDTELTDVGTRMLASRFGGAAASEKVSLAVAAETKFLADAAPASDSLTELKLLAGTQEPPPGKEGFTSLETALSHGLPANTALARSYAQHISANIEALKTDQAAAYIATNELTEKYQTAVKAAKQAQDMESIKSLNESLKKAYDPSNRILGRRDFDACSRIISRALRE